MSVTVMGNVIGVELTWLTFLATVLSGLSVIELVRAPQAVPAITREANIASVRFIVSPSR